MTRRPTERDLADRLDDLDGDGADGDSAGVDHVVVDFDTQDRLRVHDNGERRIMTRAEYEDEYGPVDETIVVNFGETKT